MKLRPVHVVIAVAVISSLAPAIVNGLWSLYPLPPNVVNSEEVTHPWT